ncbi:MAG: hypothetical protein C0490_15425 [Marivirga sp.]|nr:hypothetical protein [Marivirga sp.]
MKNLIAYYSFTENNEKLAKYLQKELNCDIAKIETTKKRTGLSILFDLMFNRNPATKPVPFSLQDYDHIVFIAPIWASKIATPMKSFLMHERSHIKQYSFITLCGGSVGQKEKIQKELVSIVQKSPLKLVELWINDLLPAERKDRVKHTSGFRIEPNGFGKFESKLKEFIKGENMIEAI